jgi:hypothetical protein
MTYAATENIRDHAIKVRFNDREHELVKAWVNYTGQQMAVLVRQMILQQAAVELGLDSVAGSTSSEGTQNRLFGP